MGLKEKAVSSQKLRYFDSCLTQYRENMINDHNNILLREKNNIIEEIERLLCGQYLQKQ